MGCAGTGCGSTRRRAGQQARELVSPRGGKLGRRDTVAFGVGTALADPSDFVVNITDDRIDANPGGGLLSDTAENGSGLERQRHSRGQGENVPHFVVTFGPAA